MAHFTAPALAAFAAFTLLAAPVLAQEANGVKIKGNNLMSTNVGTAANVAIGQDNVAKQRIGTVSGNVEIKGNNLMSTNVGTAANVAIGKGNKACQEIGIVTSDAGCK
jgi:azurin